MSEKPINSDNDRDSLDDKDPLATTPSLTNPGLNNDNNANDIESANSDVLQYRNSSNGNLGSLKRTETTASKAMSAIRRASSVVVDGVVHIFDASLMEDHRKVFVKFFPVVILMSSLVLGSLSVFWGSNYKRNERYHKINIWVIDWDQGYNGSDPIVGPSLTATTNFFTGDSIVNFDIKNINYTEDGLQRIRHDIIEEKAWGAIVINRNATESILAARETFNSSFTSDYLIQYIYAQARLETTHAIILSQINALSTVFVKSFTNAFISNIAQNSTDSEQARFLREVPQLISNPVSVTVVNVLPFIGDVSQVIVLTGLVFIIVISFFQFLFFHQIHLIMLGKVPFFEYVLYRIFINIVSYFFLSLAFSIVSLAFQVDFNHKYGRGGFVVFWMMNWLTMCALGGATENWSLLIFPLFPPLIGFGIITWVMLNSSVVFAPFELMPGVYKYGYMMPLYQASHTNRTILFGAKSIIGRSVGILFAWIVVNTILLVFNLKYAMYQKSKTAKMNEEEAMKTI